MKYSGAEIIINILERQGIDTIAGIPGGANLPLYNALYKSKIKHVLARHEQGAGFIAHGQARSTGKPAVCFATSGPGATNLLTAIADAKLDSVPIIAITGQVPTSSVGTDAFQEVDTYGMTIPITKHNFFVRSAAELLEIVPAAFDIAGNGRPGPVVIDLPKDVQKEIVEFDSWPEIVETGQHKGAHMEPGVTAIARAVDMINNAKKPVLYIGGGIIASGAEQEIISLARKNHIPVTSTLMGLGAFPSDDPLYISMLGMHGAGYTNFILKEADLLIAVGVRFDDRATGKVSGFCPQADILHIDVDPSEIDKIKKSNHFITGNAKHVISAMLDGIEENSREEWIARTGEIRTRWPMEMPVTSNPYNPINLILKVAELAPEDAIITTDVGQHQMWTAQVYPFKFPRTFLTSGGLGTMGFGVPTAIGAALANPDKRVICISGDGSFLMNIQALAVMADTGVHVTVLVLNNQHLGLVRQQQQLFYDANFIASQFYTTPDFASAARAFGVKGYDLKSVSDPTEVLKEALTAPGPVVVDIPIHHEEKVFPIVPPGAANHEMIGGVKYAD